MSIQNYLVDIPMCVYNHEKYIAQAIEGIINQKTNFNYRLLIGDDGSKDNTREIIEQYVKRYPDKIQATFHDRNLGVVANSEILFSNCDAKYIALCDGDDFWTDPHKLQKQISFLENRPEFAICFHNANILDESIPDQISYSNPPNQAEVATFDDIAKGEFIYTCTCVFRNDNFKKLPRKYWGHLNNYTIDLQNAQYGKIKYINEVMSTYRIHNGGIWSMVAREKTLISQLPTYKFYLDYFDKKYKRYFIAHLQNMTAELVSIKLKKEDFKDFWKYYKDYIFYNGRDRKQLKHIASIFLEVCKKKVIKLFNTNG